MSRRRRRKIRPPQTGKPEPAVSRKERVLGWMRQRISNGLKVALFVAAGIFVHTLVTKGEDPSIDLRGRVVDGDGRAVEKAYVEWHASSDDLRENWKGIEISDPQGHFQIYERRMRGTRLTVSRVSAESHDSLDADREFKFLKGPIRRVPDTEESTTFVLRRRDLQGD